MTTHRVLGDAQSIGDLGLLKLFEVKLDDIELAVAESKRFGDIAPLVFAKAS